MLLKEYFRKYTAIYFVLSILVFLTLYFESVIKIFNLWIEDGYSHGYLLLIVAAYLFYKQLQEVNFKLDFSPSLPGILVLAGLACVWFVAQVIFVIKVEQISLFMLLAAFVWAYLGFEQSKRFFFPILIMLLSVPLVELFNDIFQEATAVLTGVLLGLTGVPVIVEGLLILVPAGTFQVDTSCSGVRVVTVGIVLALLYSYMHRLRLLDGMVFVLLTTAVSFLSNIIRVYIIVVAGNMTNMQHSLVDDHGHLGWFVFAIVISIYLFFIHRFWSHKSRESDKEQQVQRRSTIVSNKYRVLAGIALVFVAGGGPASYYSLQNQMATGHSRELVLPEAIDTWGEIKSGNIDWNPSYKAGKGDIVIHKGYNSKLNEKIYIYLSLFSQQSESNEAINVDNRVYDRETWSKVSFDYIPVDEAHGDSTEVEEILIRDSKNREMLVWRVYIADGKITGNPYRAKLYNLLGVLKGEPAVLVYIVATNVSSSYDEARKVLVKFWQSSLKTVRNIY